MDVVDLTDFVQLFGHSRREGTVTGLLAHPRLAIKVGDISSPISTVALPLPAYGCARDDDLEKTMTEKSIEPGNARGVEKIVTALDWTGPDDPENPENWSTRKKAFHIAYVGLQCFVVYVCYSRESCSC